MRNILDPENTDGLPEQKAGVKYVLGGRSFSTYRGDDKGMNQVFDSGGDSKQGDIASGGSAFVADRDNPCGYPLVLTSCEVSGTLAAYRVNEGKGSRAKPESPFAVDNGQGGNGGNRGGALPLTGDPSLLAGLSAAVADAATGGVGAALCRKGMVSRDATGTDDEIDSGGDLPGINLPQRHVSAADGPYAGRRCPAPAPA